MKKKRFMRLLMAQGIQRNEAAAATWAASKCVLKSYEKAYDAFQRMEPYPWRNRAAIMQKVVKECTVTNHFQRILQWGKAERLKRLSYILAHWKGFESTATDWGIDLASAPDHSALCDIRPPRRNDAVDAFVYAFEAAGNERRAEHAVSDTPKRERNADMPFPLG